MNTNTHYEQYPWWIVFLSNAVSFAIYAIGAYIMYQIGPVWLAMYLLFLLFLEIRLMKTGCVNCYYYGKRCAFGKGKLSSLLFKRGDTKKFNQCHITWKEILPDFLVSIIPLLVGIVVLIAHFSILLLLLLISLVAFTTVGNGFIRGSLACCHCTQREIGCPAEQLFNKQGKNT